VDVLVLSFGTSRAFLSGERRFGERTQFWQTSEQQWEATACFPGDLARKDATMPATMTKEDKKFSTVPLDWKEVYYTNCPLVSASNVDQELGWTREEYKKIGIKYAFLRSRRENNWYPHYIHNLDNLIRFGGCNPAIHVQADIRRTKLLGLTHVPYEGGCLMVRAKDDI